MGGGGGAVGGVWYLKAVWPDLLGVFLRSGRPRGPGKAFKNVGGFAPHSFEGSPGLPGPSYCSSPRQKKQKSFFENV